MTAAQNEAEPTVLYKYVPANRAAEILPEKGNGTLRATQPAALNDPLECASQCAAVYPSANEEDREMLDALNWITPEHSLTLSEIQLARRQLGTQAWNDLFRKQLSQRFGVVCFSSSFLHPLMWTHYADSGAGFVIGYRVSELKKIPSGYERLGPVQYLEEPPLSTGHVIFKDENNLHITLLIKANYWAYEREWRLTVELKNTVGTGKTDASGHSINLYPIPNESVTEVYFTERTPESEVEIIRSRLSNPANRFRAGSPRKLILSSDRYGYTE